MVGGSVPGRGWPSSDWRDCAGWKRWSGADAPATAGGHPRPVPSTPWAATCRLRRGNPPPSALRGQACRWGDGGTSRSSEAESGGGWARRHPVSAGLRNLPRHAPTPAAPDAPALRTPRAGVPQGGTGGRDGTPWAPGCAISPRPTPARGTPEAPGRGGASVQPGGGGRSAPGQPPRPLTCPGPTGPPGSPPSPSACCPAAPGAGGGPCSRGGSGTCPSPGPAPGTSP